MARELRNARLNIVCDEAGAPQSASIDYEIWDDKASKSATHQVQRPEGAAGRSIATSRLT